MSTALITGASAGLGAELARLFAADHHDLILVARRQDRLDALAAELAQAHGVGCQVLACDLGAEGGARALLDQVAALGVEVDFLVNNAGFGQNGAFAHIDAERQLGMIRLNILALTELCRGLLPGMIARGRGRLLNLGSTAGFQPGPYMAVYYASKAYVNTFSEGLAHELRGTGVTCTVSCPGATSTEFAEVAGTARSRLFRSGVARPEVVARQAYRAMHRGRAVIVHGARNRWLASVGRLAPRAVVRAVAASLNRPPEGPTLPGPSGS